MINQPTTLILGAGASSDYEYPTGRELLVTILGQYKNPEAGSNIFLQKCGFSSDLISEFRDALSLSNQPSVDLFLEKRPEFLELGKAAIATILIPLERQEILDRSAGPYRWYQYLWERLSAPLDKFDDNKLSVVTFNYDRSLEHVLFLSLKHTYGLNDKEAATQLKTIEIVHVYGKLNELSYLQEGGRPYSPQIDTEIIRSAIPAIKILHEGVDNSLEFTRAKELLMQASVICFLGFGYHETNIRRLGFNEMHGKRSQPDLWGTSLGLTRSERLLIQEKIPWRMNQFVDSGDMKIVEYLRHDRIIV